MVATIASLFFPFILTIISRHIFRPVTVIRVLSLHFSDDRVHLPMAEFLAFFPFLRAFFDTPSEGARVFATQFFHPWCYIKSDKQKKALA
jgi:hypothetical protein